VVVTLQDVTERERLERAERDFVTNAAHELQTPLAAITSAVEVLQAGAKERPEDRDRFLQHIAHACRRLDRLTRALLVLARAQIGEQVRREVVAVEPILRTVATAQSRERTIRIECGDDVAVIANRALLEQALANLVENAIKHTTGPVVLAAQSDNRHVTMVVRDAGGGIADADRRRVFERFYRGEQATESGSGLGLAIVAEAARALGADLELESSPSGTSVAIVLPAARLVSR
jgi:signal transduction histidine kinase